LLFIKSEVILSFLGFGVGVDTVSLGAAARRGAKRSCILVNGVQIARPTGDVRCW